MNKIRFGANLLAGKITGKRIPFQVNIHVNDVCNLRCRYCYVDFDNASKDFPLPAMKRVFREARALGAERVSLEGGEPLLRNDIGEIIRFVRGLGLECNINSNGYLVPKRIDELKQLSLLSISMDGDETVHDAMRGRGSFKKAIAAIKTAKDHGIKVHVLCVLNKVNRGSLDYLIGLARDMGFQFVPNSVFFSPDEKFRDRVREKEYMLSDDEYRDMINDLARKKKEGAPIVWSLQTLKQVASWPDSYGKSNLWHEEAAAKNGWLHPKCSAGTNFCVIQTNGELYTCDPLLGYGTAPNCIELGFKEAWARLETGKCAACSSLVCNEYHHLFGLKPGTVLNLLRNYGRG